MGLSGEMGKKIERGKMIYTRLEPAQHAKVRALIVQSGATQDQFVFDAVAEKLERGNIDTTDVGVLRDLRPEDRALVQWIADLLRKRSDSIILRDVLVAQKGVLLAVAE